MNIGAQFQWDDPGTLHFNKLVKPMAMMGINVMKREFYEQLIADNPNVKLIWRHYPDRPWADNPEQRAKENVAFIVARISGIPAAVAEKVAKHGRLARVASAVIGQVAGFRDLIDKIVDNNEYFHSGDYNLHPLADRYMAAFVVEARKAGFGALVGNISCGHFAGETVDTFPLTLQALQDDSVNENPSLLAFHEYDWPTLKGNGDHWLCGKFLRAMPPIIAKYPDVKCAITEFGVDRGVIPGQGHVGWDGVYEETEKNVSLFCGEEGLTWYNRIVPDYVAFLLIFGCGMGDDWRGMKFDISGSKVVDFIATLSQENGGNGDVNNIEVLDRNYQPQTLEWAQNKYGVKFRRASVLSGQKVWRLVGLYEVSGPVSLITKTVDTEGHPIADVDMAFHWPGAPLPPDPPTQVTERDWHPNFVHGPTNANGDVGPGMGGQGAFGPGECGPHAIWARGQYPSDIVECLGWLAGTNHDHLNQRLALVTEGGNGDDPDPEPTGELVYVGSRVESNTPTSMFGIAYPLNVSIDTRGAGTEPVGKIDDTLHPDTWQDPETGKDYALVEMCVDFNDPGGTQRQFTIQVYRMSDGRVLAEDTVVVSPLGAPRRHTICIFEHSEEPDDPDPDPGPGPTPEPGELMTKLDEIEAATARIREIVAEWDAMAEDLASLI